MTNDEDDGEDRYLKVLRAWKLDELSAEEREFFLSQLTRQERAVIIARLGLDGGRALSLEEAAEHFDTTTIRVQAVELMFLRQLRTGPWPWP